MAGIVMSVGNSHQQFVNKTALEACYSSYRHSNTGGHHTCYEADEQ